MKSQQRPSLLALSALLLCTLHQTAGSSRSHGSGSTASSASASTTTSSSPSELRDGNNVGTNTSSNHGNHSHESRPPPKLEEVTGHVNSFSFNTSRSNITTVMSERSGRVPNQSPEDGVSPLCAYRVIEGGIGGQLCFRDTLFGYKCNKGDCRTVVSAGDFLANILINGSVLLQWTHERESTVAGPGVKTEETTAGQNTTKHPGTNLTREETLQSNTVFGRRQRRGGFELSCWWNGSYTQFECAGIHLGSSCRDFLLTELHENIPYRLCLRSLARFDSAQRADQRDCVEFTVPSSGMQDIVIAMTTVGGAICVMLVIICLLVAYITENIMSPTTQHSYSYRTHSRH